MAVDFVRVVYCSSSVNIDLDGRIRTYSDIAEAAAAKHLGRSAAAEVPASALSLRGPVAVASKDLALAALTSVGGGVELSDEIDCVLVTSGAWFLLTIDLVDPSRTLAALRGGGARTESRICEMRTLTM